MAIPHNICELNWSVPTPFPAFQLTQNRHGQYELSISLSDDTKAEEITVTVYVVKDYTNRGNEFHNSYRTTVKVDGDEQQFMDTSTYFYNLSQIEMNEDADKVADVQYQFEQTHCCSHSCSGNIGLVIEKVADTMIDRLESILGLGVVELSVCISGWQHGPH